MNTKPELDELAHQCASCRSMIAPGNAAIFSVKAYCSDKCAHPSKSDLVECENDPEPGTKCGEPMCIEAKRAEAHVLAKNETESSLDDLGDKPTLCIYHGTCFDGFASAWVTRKWTCGVIDFHVGVYGEPPPDVKGRDVCLVDFSYKRPVMEQIVADAAMVTVLDHHKTAEADLKDLQGAKVVFDMEKSGAGVTWDYLFPECPRPPLIDYIEDRDLWRFALPHSRLVHAALSSYPYDFNVWDELMARPIQSFFDEGEIIERKHFQDIESLLPVVTRTMTIGGYTVPVANMPITMTSDAGMRLAKGAHFSACYWDTPNGRTFSLRSLPGSTDVSEIAKAYGGGGHANAAGFQATHGWEGDGGQAN